MAPIKLGSKLMLHSTKTLMTIIDMGYAVGESGAWWGYVEILHHHNGQTNKYPMSMMLELIRSTEIYHEEHREDMEKLHRIREISKRSK